LEEGAFGALGGGSAGSFAIGFAEEVGGEVDGDVNGEAFAEEVIADGASDPLLGVVGEGGFAGVNFVNGVEEAEAAFLGGVGAFGGVENEALGEFFG
jgi:hypothetical protein